MCSKEVVVTGPGAALQTSRVQLLPNGHPRRATRSQQMTSFSPSQLKSELRWFPSTARPLSLTGYDCCQPTLTASTAHTNHSSVGRRANGAVVCSWVFKIRCEASKDVSYSGQGQLFHYGLYRTAGKGVGDMWSFAFSYCSKVRSEICLEKNQTWRPGGPASSQTAPNLAGWQKNKHQQNEMMNSTFSYVKPLFEDV